MRGEQLVRVLHPGQEPLDDLDAHVAAWLGQSQLSVTAGYQHAEAEGLAAVAERFGETFSEKV